jgi:large subunit ribosomal protein L15
MKLHDLRPADGSRQPRIRVGRGIAAGKGKTAGRGTKGQKARAGGSIPPWFEGGQTPLHMRIPKLRGFKNRFKIEYEVVNVGAIGALAERGAFELDSPAGKTAKAAPITINQDILRAVGLVRTLNKPLKILGAGELSIPLFVVADAFTASARTKIEAAGGSVNVLEMPSAPLAALGLEEGETRTAREPRTAAGRAAVTREAGARAARETDTAEVAAEATAKDEAKAKATAKDEAKATKDEAKAKPAKATKAPKAERTADATPAVEVTGEAEAAPEATAEAEAVQPTEVDESAAADAPSGDDA